MDSATQMLDVLLPVHNEGTSIERTIREIYAEVTPLVQFRFIICEDGSTDDSKDVLKRLSKSFPMTLFMEAERKGYSQAVIDGMKAVEAPYVLCLEGDGQADPQDFGKFWRSIHDADVIVGWRVNRQDTVMRRAMSRGFYWAYRSLFRVPLHDPSFAFVLTSRKVIQRLVPELGEMQEGLWWEFNARAHRYGFSLKEIPVNHRLRVAGGTQVYPLRRLPGIARRHFVALFEIWSQTRAGRS